MAYDANAFAGIACPLCGRTATLKPIRFGRRLRAGPFSFIYFFPKSHECTSCGATFSTNELINANRKARGGRPAPRMSSLRSRRPG